MYKDAKQRKHTFWVLKKRTSSPATSRPFAGSRTCCCASRAQQTWGLIQARTRSFRSSSSSPTRGKTVSRQRRRGSGGETRTLGINFCGGSICTQKNTIKLSAIKDGRPQEVLHASIGTDHPQNLQNVFLRGRTAPVCTPIFGGPAMPGESRRYRRLCIPSA